MWTRNKLLKPWCFYVNLQNLPTSTMLLVSSNIVVWSTHGTLKKRSLISKVTWLILRQKKPCKECYPASSETRKNFGGSFTRHRRPKRISWTVSPFFLSLSNLEQALLVIAICWKLNVALRLWRKDAQLYGHCFSSGTKVGAVAGWLWRLVTHRVIRAKQPVRSLLMSKGSEPIHNKGQTVVCEKLVTSQSGVDNRYQTGHWVKCLPTTWFWENITRCLKCHDSETNSSP